MREVLDGRGSGRILLLRVGELGLEDLRRRDEEVLEMAVRPSETMPRFGGHDDVGDVVVLEVFAEGLGLDVLIDKDDDLRVELAVSGVLDEGASELEEDVGFPVSSRPGDLGNSEVVRDTVKVGSDETGNAGVVLLDVVREGFRNGGGGEDKVRRLDLPEERRDDRVGVVDEVGVWKEENRESVASRGGQDERDTSTH